MNSDAWFLNNRVGRWQALQSCMHCKIYVGKTCLPSSSRRNRRVPREREAGRRLPTQKGLSYKTNFTQSFLVMSSDRWGTSRGPLMYISVCIWDFVGCISRNTKHEVLWRCELRTSGSRRNIDWTQYAVQYRNVQEIIIKGSCFQMCVILQERTFSTYCKSL